MEYRIREARITEVDRFGALCSEKGLLGKSGSSMDVAGLLRQLVYIPNATILLAESGREMAGGAILALRPSISAGGFIGTVDLLVVKNGHSEQEVASALIAEIVRSAPKKGCVQLEVSLARNASLRDCWQGLGFVQTTSHTYRLGVAARAPATRK